MIEYIKLERFKAYNDFKIDLNNKNLLVYGDNGTGKSSLYEALKLAFYKSRILGTIIYNAEEKEQKINEVLSREYDNRNNINFKITINDKIIEANSNLFDFDFDVHLLNLYSTVLSGNVKAGSKNDNYKTLNLKDLIEREYISIDINGFKNVKDEIIERVNKKLLNFKENIKIDIKNNYDVYIKDDGVESQYLHLYFNEAKVNLVVLLLLIVSIDILKSDKNQVIVLDDLITSLDIANRTFILKYILEIFNKDNIHLIIFTHNLEFFNLCKYIIEEKIVYSMSKKWLFKQLFEVGNLYKVTDVTSIEFDIIDKKIKENPEEAGNLIRKKFENLVHNIAKDLIIGSIESSDSILTTILENENVYLKSTGSGKKQKFYTANDLIIEIEKMILDKKSIVDIKKVIDEYRIDGNRLLVLKNILNELKLYRKVIMHPLSHTQAQFSVKEFYKSLDLLKSLEKSVLDIVNRSLTC